MCSPTCWEFGGRDHTTVIHAVDKITNLMKDRRQIFDQVTTLMHRIKSGQTGESA
jgi:chromosomal replication initiator protein